VATVAPIDVATVVGNVPAFSYAFVLMVAVAVDAL